MIPKCEIHLINIWLVTLFSFYYHSASYKKDNGTSGSGHGSQRAPMIIDSSQQHRIPSNPPQVFPLNGSGRHHSQVLESVVESTNTHDLDQHSQIQKQHSNISRNNQAETASNFYYDRSKSHSSSSITSKHHQQQSSSALTVPGMFFYFNFTLKCHILFKVELYRSKV